jgi:2-dehydro-3-deoxy-D-arabinonate dehydratase
VVALWQVLAPAGGQPVWAAGVTFRRSRDARLEESSGLDVYDKIYRAERHLDRAAARAEPAPGDRVTISISGLGELTNPVELLEAGPPGQGLTGNR